MSKKQRIEITIETVRKLEIRRGEGSFVAGCSQCADRVWMVAPELACALAGVGARSLYREVEGDALHFYETPNRRLFICLPSLLRWIGGEAPQGELRQLPDG